MLSQKALLLKPSPTMAMANKARELAAQGHHIVSLTVGEPDWPTFEVANHAAIEAINSGFTKYTAAAGIPELRAEIAKQTSADLGVSYSVNQCVVGTGAKFVIYALLQMLVDQEDEVLVPSPYWVSYPTMAELAGGKAKIIECGEKDRFKLTASSLEAAIGPRSKILVLCSPSNPTGLVYSPAELKALAQVIQKFPKLMVISDDIYNRLVFSSARNNLIQDSHGMRIAAHLLNLAPQLKDQVIVVNGASKTYAMTGWRVGWALGPEKLMKAMSDFLSQSTSNVTSVAQKAALAALQQGLPELQEAVQKLETKKERMFRKFKQFKFIQTIEPDGAFYFWVKIESCYGKKISFANDLRTLRSSKDIADILLEKYFLAVMPGAEFGAEGFLRLSIAVSDAELDLAFERLLQFEADLS